MESIWKKGNVQVGELNFASAAYAAGYCLKKVNGKRAWEHYRLISDDGEWIQIRPEYVTMSRRPGIGAGWFEKYGSDVFPSDEVPVVGKGIIKKAPRYYDEILRRENEPLYEEVKALREIFRREHAEDYTPERLMSKYKIAKKKEELNRRTL